MQAVTTDGSGFRGGWGLPAIGQFNGRNCRMENNLTVTHRSRPLSQVGRPAAGAIGWEPKIGQKSHGSARFATIALVWQRAVVEGICQLSDFADISGWLDIGTKFAKCDGIRN
ncbi:MAG: hypothetical protein H6994_18115 [Pseudomonadales bacterium]|nr:hypothetical protein [Pseudomonadales bacterium]